MAGGKHAHWSEFDETLEQASWNEIQDGAEAGGVPSLSSGAALRLAELARSSGYADADSHVSDLGLEAPDDEDAERAARREQFDAYMDGPYWGYIDRSQTVLSETARVRSDAATVRRVAADIAQAMRDAYEAGRTERLGMESGHSSAPHP